MPLVALNRPEYVACCWIFHVEDGVIVLGCLRYFTAFMSFAILLYVNNPGYLTVSLVYSFIAVYLIRSASIFLAVAKHDMKYLAPEYYSLVFTIILVPICFLFLLSICIAQYEYIEYLVLVILFYIVYAFWLNFQIKMVYSYSVYLVVKQLFENAALEEV